MRVKKGTFAKFYLVDGAGLTAESNNPVVVPNSDSAFRGKTGQEARRTVEIYGLSSGTTLIAFSNVGTNDPVVTMQVEVVELPGHTQSFVKFSAKAAALTGPNLHPRYVLDFTQTITVGPPENLFNSIPGGTKHIVVNCHGQMNAKGSDGQMVDGLTLYIAGNVFRGNCSDVFAKLKGKCSGGVVWAAGCEVASDNEFCRLAVMASGCFLVAPAITLPIVKVPHGMIDYFGESMVKFFNKENGTPMKAGDFLLMQKDLQFNIVSG